MKENTRKKIIEESFKKCQLVVLDGLNPLEVPVSITVNGSQGTEINCFIELKAKQ